MFSLLCSLVTYVFLRGLAHLRVVIDSSLFGLETSHHCATLGQILARNSLAFLTWRQHLIPAILEILGRISRLASGPKDINMTDLRPLETNNSIKSTSIPEVIPLTSLFWRNHFRLVERLALSAQDINYNLSFLEMRLENLKSPLLKATLVFIQISHVFGSTQKCENKYGPAPNPNETVCVNSVNTTFTCPTASCFIYNKKNPSIGVGRPSYQYFQNCAALASPTEIHPLVWGDNFNTHPSAKFLTIREPFYTDPNKRISKLPGQYSCNWDKPSDLNAWRPTCDNCK
ncbi:hypothetical protein O181_074870 [Austropuccinia psidii MF-1]|uniref:Uncharacterized protein n=1 Tax=Austropuccinia psidii MF-1 TaxID=1389203 RepID=A0A9Q3F5G5_9BASI|nr:hypothetical protein [Austropuccinia psidii MF-1]